MAEVFIQYSVGGQPVGPFQMEDLEEMVRARRVDPGTLFSEVGSGKWRQAQEVFLRLGVSLRRPRAEPVVTLPSFYEEGFFIVGSLLLALGLLLLVGAWLSGISVDSTTSLTGGVVNLGKVSDRELWALTGIGVGVIGALLQILGAVVFFGRRLTAADQEKARQPVRGLNADPKADWD